MADQRLLTIREASARLGVQDTTLRKWVREKKIPYHKLGRTVRVSADDVDNLIRKSYRAGG